MKIDFGLMGTDPEFASLFEAFAMEEVPGQDDLDGKTRMMAILAALLGCQGVETFGCVLPAAMEEGVTPVEIKEIIYQARESSFRCQGSPLPAKKCCGQAFL